MDQRRESSKERRTGGRAVAAVLTLALIVGIAECAIAQHLYLDANGDGVATEADKVVAGANMVDVWLVTNANADGSGAKLPAADVENLTINSYEFILRAEGGTVDFGEYTNLRPTMSLPLKAGKSNAEIHVGFAGAEILPPGKYHLGRLAFRVLDGNPSLSFRGQSDLDARFGTSFGSRYIGVDGDNTLKLAAAAAGDDVANRSGDWMDASGLLPDVSGERQAASLEERADLEILRFAAQATRGTSPAGAALRVTTTKLGTLRVLLFDVQGRLVQTLAKGQSVTPGFHEFRLGAEGSPGRSLATGVYFYRVIASEGELDGRIVLLK